MTAVNNNNWYFVLSFISSQRYSADTLLHIYFQSYESLHDEVLFTAIERKIFFYLYENRDSILTKEHFFEYLWQLEDRNPNIVNVHIKKIRAKINDQAGEMIENIYGEGYRLNTGLNMLS